MPKRVFVVPHFHYDAAWLDTYEGYLALCHRHILEALSLLKADPDYRFVLDQVALIRPFLERYPEQARVFKQLVAEGRLAIVCGMFVMPDANMPGGESFLRQIEAGRTYCQRELGVDVEVGWMLDVFGNHPQIPQLMRQSGFDSYVFGRCMPPDSPSEFVWRGLDGSTLVCHWMPYHYVVFYPAPSDGYEFERFVDERVAALSPHASRDDLLMLNGMDFAPPQRHVPDRCREFNVRRQDVELRVATPSEFLDRLEPEGLPTLEGDFNAIFQGCYSARIRLKQLNRRAEVALGDAERWGALAALEGHQLPAGAGDEMERAWERTMLAQFHDVICGCHIDAVYDEAVADLAAAITTADRHAGDALRAIARGPGRAEAALSLVVFNSLSWDRTDIAETTIAITDPGVTQIGLRDEDGTPVPFQFLEAERYGDGGLKQVRLAFIAEHVPATGCRTYAVHYEPTPQFESQLNCIGTPLDGVQHHVHECVLANEFQELRLDGWSGALTALTHRRLGEFIDPERPWGNTIVKQPDHGDPWEYNGPCKGGSTAPTNRPMPFPKPHEADFSHNYGGNGVVSCGPVLGEFSIASPFGRSSRAHRVRIYAGMPRVDFATTITNHDSWVRYRAAFPTPIRDGTTVREIPFGAIEQPEGEWPAQNWMDYSDGERGLALLNRGLPGNNVTDGVLMVSLLKCTTLRRPDAEGAMESGQTHTLEYALVLHTGNWREAGIVCEGLAYNNPLRVVKAGREDGGGPRRSLLRVGPQSVVCSAVRHVAGRLLIRVYETAGERTRAALELSRPIRAATGADLIGRPRDARASWAGRTLETDLRPFEIRTFLLEVE